MFGYALLDVLIAAPLIPLMPFAITWWLPWERWLKFERIPAKVAGPYLLYVAFAEWHFKLHLWAVILPAVVGLIVCAFAVAGIIRDRRNPPRWSRNE